MDFKKIEKKWQRKWEQQKLYEAKPDRKRKKFFTSLVIPYVNGNAHIGHSFTFTRTDVYARYKMLLGYNTLLAQAFHATGEPILGTVERIKKGDKSQIDTFKLFGAKEKDIREFEKKGPLYVAQFWSKKMEESFKKIGFAIDWRRKFILSITPQFSRFVEWQYNTLRKKGYVVQGTHPVIWCPKDQSPTGDHDRLEGEGESPQDYVLLKFQYKDYILPAATLRPETLYGVTNIWVNPEAEYLILKVNNEKWIVSKFAAQKLLDQLKYANVEKEFDIQQIIGKTCISPGSNKEIPILPASFVDPDNATGIVMSVPSHAPYDWIALKELIDKNELELYGFSERDIEPISIISTPGLGEHPAIEICNKMNIKTTKQDKELDEATNTIYKKEFHLGVLNEKCGQYSGIKVSDIKERLIIDFIKNGIADIMWETTGKVVCRCTTKCHVKILENQWFLKFSDEKWKDLVRKHLKNVTIYPEEAKNNFENTIEWLKDKACARKSGLGTKLPWDKDWIVETLSDSTIYMAYYTISHIITKNRIPSENLKDELFDFVFLGKGELEEVAKRTGIKKSIIKQMKEEFDYFYPIDMRNSAKDLVQNHLTFYLFHHVAIFNEDKWPKGISVNGYVNVEGEKMSKSRGNIIPLVDLINEYGADLVRINIACSAEGMEDADWRVENIKGYRSRLEFIEDCIKKMKKGKYTKERNIEKYLVNRINKNTEIAKENYEKLKFRTAVQYALFETTNDIKWYLRRVGEEEKINKKVLKECLEYVVKIISPLTPHFSEEMWHQLGNKKSVFKSEWPGKKYFSDSYEIVESMIKQTLSDIEEIKTLIKIKPKKAKIYVAENWKFEIYEKIFKEKSKGINEITKEIMSSGKYGKATIAYIQSLYNRINELKPVINKEYQINALKESKEFLMKEIELDIEIIDADSSNDQKARQATPQKFGILLE